MSYRTSQCPLLLGEREFIEKFKLFELLSANGTSILETGHIERVRTILYAPQPMKACFKRRGRNVGVPVDVAAVKSLYNAWAVIPPFKKVKRIPSCSNLLLALLRRIYSLHYLLFLIYKF